MKKTYIRPRCVAFPICPSVLAGSKISSFDNDPDGTTGGSSALSGEKDFPWQDESGFAESSWEE